MKVLDKTAKWFAFKLDQFAKRFISKQDLMDIAVQEQKTRINSMKVNLVSLSASRKNLESDLVKNKEKFKKVEAKVISYIKAKKDDIAKIQIKNRLEIEGQNKFLVKSISVMKKREDYMKRTLEKLRNILEYSENKVEFFRTAYKAASTSLEAVDIDNRGRIELREILGEVEKEITTMDNKVETIQELEEEGVIESSSGATHVDTVEVQNELDRLKEQHLKKGK